MSNASIKSLVFDIGGVLIRSEDRTGREKLEAKYGLPPGEVDKLVFRSEQAQASSIGKTEQAAIWKSIASKLSLSQKELDEFQRLFWAGDRLNHALYQFIQKSRSRYTTALLSNAWLDYRRVLEEEFDIVEGRTVDFILISSELGIAKPDPRIYSILANTVQCKYDEILFVDDFVENIEAAQSLGICTIHYQPEMNLINEIKSRLDTNS
jgi:putative hydrolase of the HAD superfamily